MRSPDHPTTRTPDELLATVLGRGRVLRRRRHVVKRSVAAALAIAGIGIVTLLAAPTPERLDRLIAAQPDAATEYEADALVVEEGARGPELCLGAVLASDPPGCTGIPVAVWRWDDVPHRRTAAGVTWASVHVRGRLEGDRFIPTGPPGPVLEAPTLPAAPDSSPACPAPVFLDPAEGEAEWEEATQKAGPLPGMVAAWVTAATHAEPFIANVVVRPGKREGASRLIRQHYRGRLCLVERDQPSVSELDRISDRVSARLGRHALSTAPDYRRGLVVLTVPVAAPELRAALDKEFGKGVVTVHGRLTPVRGSG